MPADPAFHLELYVDPGAPDGDGTAASPWRDVKWAVVDDALASGPVAVWFARGSRSDAALVVERSAPGPHRLVLDGDTWGDGERASLAGVTTGQDVPKRSLVTVRGFELTDTDDQGVYWWAGDDVVLEDLVVHQNGSSPAILFEYANRSGLPSHGLVVRNNHLYDVRGECLYVGGVEDQGGPSHSDVTIERNLIHHCGSSGRNGDDWDGINVKDGLTDVVLRDNVVFVANRGVQLDSPVEMDGGLYFDLVDDGVTMGGGWGDGFAGAVFRDVVVLRAESGIYVGADQDPTLGITLERVTVHGSQDGVVFAGDRGLEATLADGLFTDNGVALQGWGQVDVDVGACGWRGEALAADAIAASCDRVEPGYIDLGDLAGADGSYFTDDDGWRAAGADVATAASDGGALGAR